jgi:tRNA pseudouridine38-40 synthase
LKLTLAYDGTDFAGWQSQPGQRTVQDCLEEALLKVTGERVRTVASGRTDAGVHALGQVVSVNSTSRLSAEILLRALNAEVPEDLAILSVEDAPPGFHAIHDAVLKRYRYVIHDGPVPSVFARRYAWHVRRRLNEEAMRRAAQALIGEHDFTSFETQGSPRASPIRRVFERSVERRPPPDQDLIHIEVEADGFLYNMVRAIIGTLVEVGRGARDEGWPAAVLAARNRSAAGATAPPHGLFLVAVEYGGNDKVKG